MNIKKNRKKNITQIELTPQEAKAINQELADKFLEMMAEHLLEIEAAVLVHLRKNNQFGKMRLKDFYDNMRPNLYDIAAKAFIEGENDQSNIEYLEEYGCPIKEWAFERENMLRGVPVEVKKKRKQGRDYGSKVC